MKLVPNQHVQCKEFVEDVGNRALNEVNLDKEGLQRLLVNSKEFQAYVTAGVRKFSAEVASDHNGLSRASGLFHEWLPPPNWCVQDDYS